MIISKRVLLLLLVLLLFSVLLFGCAGEPDIEDLIEKKIQKD